MKSFIYLMIILIAASAAFIFLANEYLYELLAIGLYFGR